MSKWRSCVLISLTLWLGFNSSTGARETKSPADESIAIVGAKMYPSADAAPVEDSVVVVKDGRIVGVGSRSDTPIPSGVRVLDARGAVLTAGFWNNHIHLMTEELLNAATANADTLRAPRTGYSPLRASPLFSISRPRPRTR